MVSVSEIVQFAQHFSFLVSCNIQKLRIQKFCYLNILTTNLTLQLFKSQHISTYYYESYDKILAQNSDLCFQGYTEPLKESNKKQIILKVNIKDVLTKLYQ